MNAKILIVDDTPANINVLFDTLEQKGYKVLVAVNGESAIERAALAKPDLILLDIMMPGIDGYETCTRLKAAEETKNIPVIFMTALSDTIDKIRGFELGAVDYITKPFQVEEVLMRVNAHLTIVEQRRELEELNTRLESINASKDKFFSIVSHDLKNVFMFIPQLSKMLMESYHKLSEEEIKETAHRLYDDAKNTQALFENLLAWSRLQMGSLNLEPDQLKLRLLIDEAEGYFARISETKNIELVNEIPNEIMVTADGNTLSTVIRNLISNALKFTEPGGKVEISAVRENDSVKISVKDTGVGIAPDDLAKIFKADVHHSTVGTGKEKGTGLGLIISKEMVEMNKGTIDVESVHGEGTEFIIRLPA